MNGSVVRFQTLEGVIFRPRAAYEAKVVNHELNSCSTYSKKV